MTHNSTSATYGSAFGHIPATLRILLGALVLLSFTSLARAQQISTPEALLSALSRAKGGEVITLAPGNYGKLELTGKTKFNTQFPKPVTITSANPKRPASFSWIKIEGAANMVFDGLVFDYTFKSGHPISLRPFSFQKSDRITIRNSVFDGDVARGVSVTDDGYGYGYGVTLNSNTNLRFVNNEIFSFNRGIVMGGGRNLAIVGNDVHTIRSDGMNFVQVTDILIEGNYLHDFVRSKKSGDHSDMIQFWTRNTTKPSTGITIRGNMLLSGKGSSTQSLFMRNDVVDRGLAGREMFYRDVVIEDNVIVNGHLHGITLGESDGVVVRRNTLLRNHNMVTAKNRKKAVTIPRIQVAGDSRRVTITGNIAPQVQKGKQGWTVKDNLVAQDVTIRRPGYYHELFTDAQTGDPRRVETFVVRKGSPADRKGLGATRLAITQ